MGGRDLAVERCRRDEMVDVRARAEDDDEDEDDGPRAAVLRRAACWRMSC